MDHLPPHKRSLTSLYRGHFWYLKGLEMKPDKTQEDKQHLASTLYELDKLWESMPPEQRRDVDPLIDVLEKSGNWVELKILRCPHCGWEIHVPKSGKGTPPRCSACMFDVDILAPMDAYVLESDK